VASMGMALLITFTTVSAALFLLVLAMLVLGLAVGEFTWERRFLRKRRLICPSCGKKWIGFRLRATLQDGKCAACGAQLFTFDPDMETRDSRAVE
jgi:hypothetical protein